MMVFINARKKEKKAKEVKILSFVDKDGSVRLFI